MQPVRLMANGRLPHVNDSLYVEVYVVPINKVVRLDLIGRRVPTDGACVVRTSPDV